MRRTIVAMSAKRISGTPGLWPLHDMASSRRAESAALQRTAPHALMQAAGVSLAKLVLAAHPHAEPVLVLAGPGNNGGDGLVVAALLKACGRSVEVQLMGDAQRLPADAALALRQAVQSGVPVHEVGDSFVPTAHPPGLVIDALLGLGSRRAAEGALAEAIVWMNACGLPIVSVDLPSGLHADTGVALGGLAVKAGTTLSLLTLKPGLFTGVGRDHSGQVWFDALMQDAPLPTAMLCDVQHADPRRPHASHKGSFGDVAVIGGAKGMQGAAVLAASAALAAGAGRVYLGVLDDEAAAWAVGRPELMMRRQWWLSPTPVLRDTTVVCGVGGGDAVREALPALLSHSARLVLDADALNAVASDQALRSLLSSRAGRGLATVITPHPLEAARLSRTNAAEVQSDRIAAAQRLSHEFCCVTVLKGSGTVVVAPDQRPTIIGSGNALLATAGTGDVLAGWIGGRWAQGRQPMGVAIESCWQHGHAADLAASAGQTAPMLASDLIQAMTRVLL